MKKFILLLLFIPFVFSCSEVLLTEAQINALNGKDLSKGLQNIVGSWQQKDIDTGDTYFLDISLPSFDSTGKRMEAFYKLQIIGYVSEKVEYRISGKIGDLLNPVKGFDKYGNKVKYLTLSYFDRNGEVVSNQRLLHVITELKSGQEVPPGAQLRFTLRNSQFRRGFTKFNYPDLYDTYDQTKFIDKFMIDENGNPFKGLVR